MNITAMGLLAVLMVTDSVAVLRKAQHPAGTILRALCALALVATVLVRSLQIGFVAIFSQFDSLIVFAALILGTVAVLEISTGPRARGVFGAPLRSHPELVLGSTLVAFVLVALANSPLIPDTTPVVMPALRSVWLPVHIGLAFLGEAFFTVAFVGSILYLVRSRQAGDPDAATRLARLDQFVYRSVAVGYGLFTVGGLVFGAVWAQQAWGRYWGWDPKETWAFVTWVVYSVYLHVRLRRWGRGRVSHWVSVIGYASAMFTLFGVNLLYNSLHAY